ncbi:MAG: phosphotransferase [Gammaproteobacteria bacterium]|nr:phosphotransferase [Gammaproteobacteria bacterium]MDH5800337.1 phosphotransferase [Gammaproteobacteria bacterium]
MTGPAIKVTRDELCDLIPHSGIMCLLDGVRDWTDDSISCISRSHQSQDNPLRRNNQLSSVHTMEYGAQAMAVHGGLLAKQYGQSIKPGYLAALRDVELLVPRIDDVEETLVISAKQLMAGDGNLMYVFKIMAGDRVISSARATVITQG